MRLTVTNTSTSLFGLMSKTQREAVSSVTGLSGKQSILLYNNSVNTVYVEMSIAATTTDGLPIPASGGILGLTVKNLDKVNLIANSNSEIRVLINVPE